jgi:hypothetical protein
VEGSVENQEMLRHKVQSYPTLRKHHDPRTRKRLEEDLQVVRRGDRKTKVGVQVSLNAGETGM